MAFNLGIQWQADRFQVSVDRVHTGFTNLTRGVSTGAAMTTAASSSSGDDRTNLWSILPSFDPEKDDPREYRDKVTFLHGICPKKDKPMLAPRLAMLLKGTAWSQIKSMDTGKLTDAEEGVKILLSSIATWEEAAEMQLFDRFEKALYRTTQKSDEVTQSYVNRMSVAFHELGDMSVKDIRAFITLRQSSLTWKTRRGCSLWSVTS